MSGVKIYGYVVHANLVFGKEDKMKSKQKYLWYSLLALAIMGMILVGGCAQPADSETEGTGGFSYTMIIFLVLIFAVFYFLMIRPQQKKKTEQRRLTEELKRGDKVITVGGILGEIDHVGENHIIIKVEDGTKLKLLKSSIMGKQQIE